jgi:hypothetical protein
MIDPLVLSLTLPYVKKESKWVMVAARTSKSLSLFFDTVQHHWEYRYRNLMAKLDSGRARFEIERYVRCQYRDSFYWTDTKMACLNQIFFAILILDHLPRSCARQAVPQMKRAINRMRVWNCQSDANATFTAKSPKSRRVNTPGGCRKSYFIGAISLRKTSSPADLIDNNGLLDTLSTWMETPDIDEGYGSDQSWECECGDSYSASYWEEE